MLPSQKAQRKEFCEIYPFHVHFEAPFRDWRSGGVTEELKVALRDVTTCASEGGVARSGTDMRRGWEGH